MDKSDVALQLASLAIEKGLCLASGSSNTEIGRTIAEFYNGIFDNIKDEYDD